MNMTNVYVLIKPDETKQDIIAELCDDLYIGPNEPFAFSAIVTPDKTHKDYYNLKINCVVPQEENPYTPTELINILYEQILSKKGVCYVQPPIEQWIKEFRPLLLTMVNKVYPRYQKLIPERDELISILYLTVMKLYNQGYYLHQTLIMKAFVNDLNMECRKLKNIPPIDSFDASIGKNDEGKKMTLLDVIPDEDPDEKSIEYWEEIYNIIKSRMLEDMSDLAFDRILIQLKSGTVDRRTSYQLDKYRRIFNPSYIPRPNSKGKSKGGNK